MKQTAKVISSDGLTGAQIIKAGRTKATLFYDEDSMLSAVEVEGGPKLSDKELLGLIARTTLIRVDLTAADIAFAVWHVPDRILSHTFSRYLFYDIRLDGGETQELDEGLWTLVPMTDLYGIVTWGVVTAHVEVDITDGGVGDWRNWIANNAPVPATFVTIDHTRVANGAAPGTFLRFAGFRTW